MEKIFFICDSPSDLRPAYVEGKNIAVISATITYDDQDHMEYPDVDFVEYWDLLEKLSYVPQTSQAQLLHYLAAMQKARDEGFTHIFVSAISSTAAGSLQNATLAYDMLREENPEKCPKIAIVDSLCYGMMYGQMILDCERMSHEGKSFDEIVAFAKDGYARKEALFMVYSLKQMRKSGRISGISAFAGEAMGIRPILCASGGKIEPVDKVRGDKKLLPRMLELFDQRVENPAEQEVIVYYAKIDSAEVQTLEEGLRARGVGGILKYPIGGCITTNTGPHCLAVIYNGKKRD